MSFPSGEYDGPPSAPGLALIFLGSPPVIGTVKISELVLVASIGSAFIAYATSDESGEIA